MKGKKNCFYCSKDSFTATQNKQIYFSHNYFYFSKTSMHWLKGFRYSLSDLRWPSNLSTRMEIFYFSKHWLLIDPYPKENLHLRDIVCYDLNRFLISQVQPAYFIHKESEVQIVFIICSMSHWCAPVQHFFLKDTFWALKTLKDSFCLLISPERGKQYQLSYSICFLSSAFCLINLESMLWAHEGKGLRFCQSQSFPISSQNFCT